MEARRWRFVRPLLRPVAHGLGLRRALLTRDAADQASRRVIERDGGVAAGACGRSGAPKLLFRVDAADWGRMGGAGGPALEALGISRTCRHGTAAG